ncbi:CHAD domain-containing protein [Candidatus Poribacteria bacterium]|nr:CHAD domain-containing protein [Candidatus Poribacteria bacterium]
MAKPLTLTGVKPKEDFHTNARIILPQKVEEVYMWENFIHDPERSEELHNMRISIKRLRYSMEFFTINYNEKFTKYLDTIIDLQDILGDIHDNDVVIDVLTNYKSDRQHLTIPGIDSLISRVKTNRDSDYNEFLLKWDKLSQKNFKENLLAIIVS